MKNEVHPQVAEVHEIRKQAPQLQGQQEKKNEAENKKVIV